MQRAHLATPSVLLLARLEDALARARSAARRSGRPVLAWASAPAPAADPVTLFARAEGLVTTRLLWARPADDLSIVGLGVAWEVVAGGDRRFATAGEAWRRCLAQSCGAGDVHGPVALGGFAFAPQVVQQPAWAAFPPGLLVVPALTVRTQGAHMEAILSVLVPPEGEEAPRRAVEQLAALLAPDDPTQPVAPPGAGPGRRTGLVGSHHTGDAPAAGTPGDVGSPRRLRQRTASLAEEHPPAAIWKALVADAAAAVQRGELRKVVLARAVTVDGIGVDATSALRRLQVGYPDCTLFAVARGDTCFLGATPERLLRVRDGMVATGALAGSAPRGTTPDDDQRRGEALLASPKDRIEHAVVVDAIREAMVAACAEVAVAAAPRLLRVSNVQHLYTPVQGRLRDRYGLLDLAGRLHPTPAVGGVPRDAALAWITAREGFERGWYAGPVGWVDATGDGELAVAIRSALLCGSRATLFAGCGIVADSDPDAEYAESCLKLRPLAEALEAPAALSGCR
ncbi:MAG: isochorismate synthase [Armatimonadota bacterium]|nr:isochorismate synthase [Armatimonadota bacterium]